MGYLFFGLTPNDKEALQLEPTFILMHHLGFTYSDAMSIPVAYRRWFVERINKERSDNNSQTISRSMQANDPEIRSLMGKQRSTVPAKLRHTS